MIVVFGSLNMDLIVPVDELPRAGETVVADGYVTAAGGKGNNQAVAAARAGGAVRMVGSVGRDGFGRDLVENLRRNGVDAEGVVPVEAPTGIAYICVDRKAENFIAVALGANRTSRQDAVPDAILSSAATVLLQMEAPHAETFALVGRAKSRGARLVLNVAPAGIVPAEVLAAIDVLVVNEIEARTVASNLGAERAGLADTASALAVLGHFDCVVTLGAAGVMSVGPTGRFSVPSLKVQAVDTTGAGDTFVGVLAAGLDAGLGLEAAARRGVAAAALACTGVGAQSAMPTAFAIEEALARLGPTRFEP